MHPQNDMIYATYPENDEANLLTVFILFYLFFLSSTKQVQRTKWYLGDYKKKTKRKKIFAF